LGIGDVALLYSPLVTVPVTQGLRRPAIILPEQLASSSSLELLTAALGHEMTHIRRRDYAWNIVYELLFLPISFHPAAALVKRRINETRELACDETVGELVMDAHDYARSLVGLANSVSLSSRPTYILGVNDADILEKRIMKLCEKIPSTAKRPARVWLGITLFALILSGAGAAAFPIKIKQNQNNEITSTNRFVGTWKGKYKPEDIVDHVIIFKMEAGRLTGSIRAFLIRTDKEGNQKLESDKYIALPELSVNGTSVTWKSKLKVLSDKELDTLNRVSLVGDNEILVEKVGGHWKHDESGSRLDAIVPVTYRLKRE
jgi:BlaR1 peptidase M56